MNNMTLQVKLDLKTRNRNIVKILKSFKTRASVRSTDVEKLFDNFKEEISKMDDDTKEAYIELKKHYYFSNFQDSVDDLDRFESGDLMILGDVRECEKEVKASVIGAYTDE